MPFSFHPRYPVYSFFLPVYSFWRMDDFSWGNTRLVIGEGSNKKVIMNDDEKWDESMIPLKKFSGILIYMPDTSLSDVIQLEYEAETWDTASRMSDETRKTVRTDQKPRSRGPGSAVDSRSIHPSMTGDFYRDANAMSQKGSHSQFPVAASQSQMSQYGGAPGFPQLPFMPFGGGPGSNAGSDYGGHHAGMPQLPYQNTGSVYGVNPIAPRNTVMTNMNMFSGDGVAPQFTGAGARPMSTFSMATSVNPFAGPSMNPDPTDDDLFNALRNYLSTQDLMTVTKK